MKSILLIIAVIFSNQIVFAQTNTTPKTNFTKMYLSVWLEARKHCLAVANAMPEELYTYKPTEVSKTFAEQNRYI